MSDPPKVLYLMANAVPGGAERATMLMLASHNRHRYQPAVLFFSTGPLVAEARRMNLDVEVLPFTLHLRYPTAVARAVAECRRLVARYRIALIHSCMSYAHLIGGAASWISGTPSVLYQHGPLGLWMDGAATALRCDRILTNSEFTAGQQRHHSWRQRPVTLAPYGVDVHIAAEERAGLSAIVNAEHGIAPDAPVVGIIARFDPWKGIDVAIRGVAPLLRSRPAMRFIIIGGQYRDFHPTYSGELRALVRKEGVAEQVIFAGYRLDVRPYLARLTALIHSSIQPEPFGLTIVEAMASGVPVVAAGAGGAAEIIENGVDGLFHTPGNAEELTGALSRLLADDTFRQSAIAAGLRKVESRYRPAAMMQAIERAYDEVLAS